MPFMLLNLLKNPTILVGIAAMAIIGYLYVSNMSLENTVLKREGTIKDQKADIKTLKSNAVICNNINKFNVSTISDFQKDLDSATLYYEKSDASSAKIIARLRKEIRDLKKPVVYEETVVYKDCEVKIKTKDEDENSTFNVISNIGI